MFPATYIYIYTHICVCVCVGIAELTYIPMAPARGVVAYKHTSHSSTRFASVYDVGWILL